MKAKRQLPLRVLRANFTEEVPCVARLSMQSGHCQTPGNARLSCLTNGTTKATLPSWPATRAWARARPERLRLCSPSGACPAYPAAASARKGSCTGFLGAGRRTSFHGSERCRPLCYGTYRRRVHAGCTAAEAKCGAASRPKPSCGATFWSRCVGSFCGRGSLTTAGASLVRSAGGMA